MKSKEIKKGVRVIECDSQPKYVGIEVNLLGFMNDHYWTYSKVFGTLWFYPFELSL